MRLSAAAVLLLASCTSPPPAVATPSPTREPGVLEVTALLELSGPRAAVGARQRASLEQWVADRASGALSVRLRVADVGEGPARAILELKRADQDDGADAVIVGAQVAYDDVLGRALETAALPVLFAQPIAVDPAALAGGRWAFALAPTLDELAGLQVADAIRRDVLAPALLLTAERDRLEPLASALAAELRERGRDPLTSVALEGSVPPVVRSSLSVVRSLHCATPLAACAAVAREAHALGSRALVYLPYGSRASEVSSEGDLAERALWPAARVALGGADVHAAAARDALSLIAAAAGVAGPDDRAALRDALEGITMPLIATTYTFSPRRHAGFAPSDLAYVRWSGGGLRSAPSFGNWLPTPTPSPRASPTPAPSPTP